MGGGLCVVASDTVLFVNRERVSQEILMTSGTPLELTTAPTAEQEWTVNDMNISEAKQVLSGLLDAFDQHEHGDYFYDHGWEVCEAVILAMPTIDAVPVVRCGECEKRSKSADLTYTIYCPWLGQQMDKTDFCSYGERKDGGG